MNYTEEMPIELSEFSVVCPLISCERTLLYRCAPKILLPAIITVFIFIFIEFDILLFMFLGITLFSLIVLNFVKGYKVIGNVVFTDKLIEVNNFESNVREHYLVNEIENIKLYISEIKGAHTGGLNSFALERGINNYVSFFCLKKKEKVLIEILLEDYNVTQFKKISKHFDRKGVVFEIIDNLDWTIERFLYKKEL